MARRNLISVYIWIVDTIQRYGALTLAQLNELWVKSSAGDGNPIPRRTFFHYRDAIEEMFNISLKCNRSTFEYYIDEEESENDSRMQQWLLDSMSMSGMLSNSRDISHRIVLENVPSARQYLLVVIDAMRDNQRIKFSYKSYKRVNAVDGIVIEPYFVKIFKQLWYVVGMNVKDGMIKTYALDRMSKLVITQDTFKMPEGFDPVDFFKDCFGITTSHTAAKDIVLRVSPTQAKYFRALPLHPSQQEEIHDSYSIFRYKMRMTYDLKEEIMSHGSDVEVMSPPELKTQIVSELKKALSNY
jgi:predicted DNA-binding transcriptional regulator YafY